MSRLVVVFVLLNIFTASLAISCYKCHNVEVTTLGYFSYLPQPPPSDESCSNYHQLTSSDAVTCPNPTDVCGYINVKADIDIKIILGISVEATYSVEVRDCIPSSGLTSQSTGCHDDITGSVENIINGFLSFTKFAGNSKLTGKSCYCSTSYCDPNCSGLYFLEKCWSIEEIIILGVFGGIAALLILSGCCCCCCCCACCKSNKTQPTQQAQPQLFVISTTHGASQQQPSQFAPNQQHAPQMVQGQQQPSQFAPNQQHVPQMVQGQQQPGTFAPYPPKAPHAQPGFSVQQPPQYEANLPSAPQAGNSTVHQQVPGTEITPDGNAQVPPPPAYSEK